MEILLLYVALGVVSALIAYCTNQLAPHPWFTLPRTAGLIVLTVVVAAVIQARISADGTRESDGMGAQSTVTQQPTQSPSAEARSPSPPESSDVTPTPSITDSANDPPTVPDSISLSQLDPVSGDVNTDPDSLLHKNYVDLVRQDVVKCNKNYADYNVPPDMKVFTAKAGLDDDYPDSRQWYFAVYTTSSGGMTNPTWKEPLKFGQYANVSVPLKGVLRLRISVESVMVIGDTCAPYIGYNAVWANAKFSS